MKEPSLRQFRYFLAVADAGQISRAAKDLSVSQSAVTAAVQQLESTIGMPLLVRRPNGVALTREGNVFLGHARRVLASVDEAVRSPTRPRDEVRGRLRLAMTYTVAGYFLFPFVERFGRAFPKVELVLTEAPREAIESGLVSGAFDLGVVLTSNLVDRERLTHETLLRSSRRLWLPTAHPLTERQAVSLADVATEPYIMLTVDEAGDTAGRYWQRAGQRPRTLFRTSSVEAVRSMVANGMGVTILSDMVYRPWSLDGRRVEVRSVADEIPSMDVGLVWTSDVPLEEPAAAFRDLMRIGS